MALYLVLGVALILAGGSFWMTLQTQNTADYNRNLLNQLKEQQDLMRRSASDNYNPTVDQNSHAIREIDQRISELSTVVDGPLSHMKANTSEGLIVKLEGRLQQLEQKLAKLKQAPVKQSTTSQSRVAATTAAPDGKLWALNLLSMSNKKAANDAIGRLEKAGVNASINNFTAKDSKAWYRVRVTGFASYDEAKAYAKEMPKVSGISQTWVTTQ